jgi:hypothetical protein
LPHNNESAAKAIHVGVFPAIARGVMTIESSVTRLTGGDTNIEK